MKKLTITLGLLVGLCAHNVQAQTNGMEARKMNTECLTPGHNIDKMFTKMDANKDGKLDKDETCEHLQENFKLIDVNADGFLSKDEVKSIAKRHSKGAMPTKFKPARLEKMFDRLDSNKDGRLEKTEAGKHLLNNFDLVDTNSNGYISKEEFMAAPMHHSKRMAKKDMKPRDFDKMFDRMDSNKDGQLEKSEAGKHLVNSFDLVDTNNNGYISKEEFMAAPMHHSKRMPKTDMEPRDFDKMLERMDTNNDGKLEKKELGKHLRDNFDVIDTDKDGFISKEEFRAIPARQNKMQHRRERKTPIGTPHMRRR